MREFAGTVRNWLKGRKTYLLAGVLMLVTLVLLLSGHLTPTSALTLLLVAACGFPATFRSALGRHRQEELVLLGQVAALGAALAVRDLAAAEAVGMAAAQGTAGLCGEIRAESAAAAAATQDPQPPETSNA